MVEGPQLTLCPYCGNTQPVADRCRACGGIFEPLSRMATQIAMGPWFVRDLRNPFRPGCSYQVLRRQIDSGYIGPTTVLRGPTTKQFWALAQNVPGVAHLLGFCHNCGEHVTGGDRSCPKCQTPIVEVPERNTLGLQYPTETAASSAQRSLDRELAKQAGRPVPDDAAQADLTEQQAAAEHIGVRQPSPYIPSSTTTDEPSRRGRRQGVLIWALALSNLVAVALVVVLAVVLAVGPGRSAALSTPTAAPVPTDAAAVEPTPPAPLPELVERGGLEPVEEASEPALPAAEQAVSDAEPAPPVAPAEAEPTAALSATIQQLLKQAEQLRDEGELEDALAIYRAIAVETSEAERPAGVEQAIIELEDQVDRRRAAEFFDVRQE